MRDDYFKNKFRIASARLKNWDYSSSGYYFVTVCVKNKKYLLGRVTGRRMCLSRIGRFIQRVWFEIPNHFNNVFLDEFVIIPNHVHGIVVIRPIAKRRDVINHVSTNIFQSITPMNKHSLGEIIRWFKGRVSFEVNKLKDDFSWQPRFYDHVIRNEKFLNEIRQYIRFNPLNWQKDDENLANQK
jgi:REP element-mobilizing transposase RayT